MLLLGFGLAIASSLALNAGYLLQHLGGASAPAVDARAPIATVRGLLRSPLWVLGMGTSLFGSVLHIGALAVAPLTLVQAFSAAGLALVVPASARLARSPLHRAERVAVGGHRRRARGARDQPGDDLDRARVGRHAARSSSASRWSPPGRSPRRAGPRRGARSR